MNMFTHAMESVAKATRSTTAIHYFPETDLRNGHKGLTEIAKKRGLDVLKIHAGEFVIFANRKNTQMKLLGPMMVLVHLKTFGNDKIDLQAIELIPRLFNGTNFSFHKASKMGLLKAA